MDYDKNNVFAKILRGEIPCNKICEDDYSFAFHDIAPAAPTHILVVPKGEFCSFSDFMMRAGLKEVQGFFSAVAKIAAQHAGTDFRLITNNGESAGQTVHHFHVHILAGKPMGPLLAG